MGDALIIRASTVVLKNIITGFYLVLYLYLSFIIITNFIHRYHILK